MCNQCMCLNQIIVTQMVSACVSRVGVIYGLGRITDPVVLFALVAHHTPSITSRNDYIK